MEEAETHAHFKHNEPLLFTCCLQMTKTNDERKYYATYKRPPRVDDEVLTRIGKMNPIASCLDEALTELMKEQQQQAGDLEQNIQNQSQAAAAAAAQHDSESSELNQQDGEEKSKIIINEKFRDSILNKFGHAMSRAFCCEEMTTIKSPPDESNDSEPPAALLHGKVKYHNRFGGQWRIVISDAEIRPRVNVDYSNLLRKRDQVSLKETSRRQMRKEVRWKRRRLNEDSDSFVMNDDGAIKIDGDLTILAFDDTV